jgi:hypothetical protein
MHKKHNINTPGDFEEVYPEEKHMHCTTQLVEMLHLSASNFGNCVESYPKKIIL